MVTQIAVHCIKLITSTTEGEGGYVFTPRCLFVCLFVCVQDISKKLWIDPDEILCTGWVCDKDKQIRFW